MTISDIIASREVAAPVAEAFKRLRNTATYDCLPDNVRRPVENWAEAPEADRRVALDAAKGFMRQTLA